MRHDRCGSNPLVKRFWMLHFLMLFLLVVVASAVPASADDLSYTFGGDANWFSQSATSHGGGNAYRSGSITNGQSSWMKTTVTGPGLVQFWWKVSSESLCDSLRFSIDGISQTDISGEIDWQSKRFLVGSGSHTLRWTYSTDGSVLRGSNAGWVDQVSFTSGSNFDLTPPTTSATPSGGAFASSQSVALSCNDGTGSCARTLYCLGAGCNPSTSYSAPVTVSSSTNFRFFSTDSAGNSETVKDVYFTIDTIPPTTFTTISAGTYTGRRDIGLYCSDSGAGCASTYYCLGSNCTPTTPYSSAIAVTASTDLRYYSTDRGGNTEAVRTASYTIIPDVTPPKTNFFPSGAVSAPFSLSLWCNDGQGSGCSATYYCLGTGCNPTTPYSSSSYLNISRSTDLRFYSTDRSGNNEAIGTVSFLIDSDPPTTTPSVASGIYTSPQTVTLSCSDGSGSGCSTTSYCLGKGCSATTRYTGPIAIASSTYLSYTSLDAVNNWEPIRTERYTILSGLPASINVPADRATIQGAIDQAQDGDAIVVAPGTYRENLDFKGKAISVTSSGGAESTIIDGSYAGPVVSFTSGEGRSSVLDGFTLRNGDSTWELSPQGFGGGVYISSSSPVIRNNRITGNFACTGGGISADGGSPLIQGNFIANNNQQPCGAFYGGGGVYLVETQGAQVIGNTIRDNTVGYGDGGGVLANGADGLVLRGNTILNNTASGNGGGIALINNDHPALIQNAVAGNRSASGGGVYWAEDYRFGKVTLVNNTIVDNDAATGGGMLVVGHNDDAVVVNNVITAKGGQTPVACNSGYTSELLPPSFNNNLVFAPGGAPFAGTCSNQDGTNDNLSADPLLGGAAFGYFGLLPVSPAIDAGDVGAPSLPDADLAGAPRIRAGTVGGTARIDIGALEYDPGAPRAVISGAPTGAVRENFASMTVGGEGIVSYRYAVDGGAFGTQDIPVSTPISLSGLAGGRHAVAVIGKSQTKEQSLAAAAVAVWTVDTIPPTTTATPGSGFYSSSQAVTLTCSDDTGSGCAGTFYCLGGGCTPNIPYTGPITVSGNAGLKFYSVDLFGNREAVRTASYTLVGTIAGRVSDAGTGQGIAGAWIEVINPTTGSWVKSAATDASGAYQIPQVPSGSYKISFHSNGYIDQWYSAKAGSASADVITVSAPTATSGIDAAMVVGGKITGTVTASETGSWIRQVDVTVYDAVTGQWVTSASTDDSGVYTVSGLSTGTYKIRFYGASGYLTQWYGNKADISSASVVSVTAAATTSGIDASLARGGSITGTVTESGSNTAIRWADVSVYDAVTGDWAGYGTTDSSGGYTVVGLSGSYKIQFSKSGYQSQWYGGASQTTAAVVTVLAPQAVTGINAALIRGGSISGRVTEQATGAGIGSASVTAYDAVSWQCLAWSSTDASGNYRFTGLPTGSYKIYVSATGFPATWLGGRGDQNSAVAIAVTAPDVATGVNVALRPGGTITGTVTDQVSGAAIPNVYVTAVNSVTGTEGGSSTDTTGVYSITGLAVGGYKVHFSASNGYQDVWYDNKNPNKADTVSVIAAGTTSGIDAALVKGGSITGRVTDSQTGLPLRWVSVLVTLPSGSYIASGYTDGAGSYRIDGVSSGTYPLLFQKDGYLSFNATVSVTQATVSTMDAALLTGGSISGIISDRTTGVGIPNAYLFAINRATGAGGPGTQTLSDGSYALTGLSSGSYLVQVSSSPDSGYIAGALDGDGVGGCPLEVSVTAPNTTTGVDALLDHGGSITGRVTDATTTLGIQNASVSVSRGPVSFGYPVGFSARVDSTGSYILGGLPSGSYQLSFEAPGYFRSTSSATVTVSAPDASGGADAALIPGGGISGSVTCPLSGDIFGTNWEEIYGLTVTATDAATGAQVGSTSTDEYGNYTISPLPSGSYRIWYQPGGNLTVMAPPSSGGAIDSIGSAASTSTRSLHPATQLGSASSVTGDAPQAFIIPTTPVADPPISLAAAHTRYAISAVRAAAGTVTTAPLVLPALPDPVAVTAPSVTYGVDFTIDSIGEITGTVTDRASGDPIPRVQVNAWESSSGAAGGAAFTDSYGSYTLGGLPPGNYRLSFTATDPTSGGYLTGWYQSSASSVPQTEVAVKASEITADIDVQLERGGGIAGTVSASVCPGPRAVRISVYDATGLVELGSTFAAPDRQEDFSLGSLPPGSYKLAMIPVGTGFLRQWYPNQRDAASAQLVTVTAGSVTGGIAFSLAAGGGSISGSIAGEAGCSLQAGDVRLYDWYSEELVAVTSIGTGRYSFTGVPDGTYKLLYQINGQPRWYRGPGELAYATPIQVSGSNAVTAIDHTESCNSGSNQGSAGLTLLDAVKALRIAVGLDAATPEVLAKYDVAPVVNGVSSPNGTIDLADALILLQRALHAPVPAQSN